MIISFLRSIVIIILWNLSINVFGEDVKVFSERYSDALLIQYNAKEKNILVIEVENKTTENISFNEPVLIPAGNIYLRAPMASYPDLGSSMLTIKIITLKAGDKIKFEYPVEKNKFNFEKEHDFSVNVFLDSVNGEKKRTHYVTKLKK